MSPDLFYKHEQPRRDLGRTLQGVLLTGALLGMLGLTISCGGGGGSSVPPSTPSTTGLVVGKVQNYISGQVISGATVTDGTTSTTTTADGTYALHVAPSDRKQLTVAASNFGNTQRITNIVGGETNHVDVALLPATVINIPDLASEVTLGVPRSPAQVVIPANGLVPSGGGTTQFPVKASLTPIDPSTNPGLMPGDYTTSTGQKLESFGALDVYFIDSTGAPLNLAPGKLATIRIPLASFHWVGTPPPAVPAWYYDTVSGRWVQEGNLSLAGAGLDQYYEGTVGHFSTWNADAVMDTAFITGIVVRNNGSVVAGATVEGQGSDYVGYTSVLSADDGSFKLPVKANATTHVTASLGYLVSPTPVISSTSGAGTTSTPLATTLPVLHSIVVDGFLNLTGTLRDFSPSAPYQFPYASTTSLTTNGTFDSDTGWTMGAGWAAAGLVAQRSSGSASSDLSQDQAIAQYVSYDVTYTISNWTAGTITVIIGGTSGTARSANGIYVERITCGSDGNPKLVFRADATFSGDIDNVSVVDPHPPAVTIDASTPFPLYTGHPILASSDGPWWNPDFEMSNTWMGAFTGLVNVTLGANNKPVFTGQVWDSGGIHSTNSFDAWWTDFPYPHGPSDAQAYQKQYTIPLAEVLPATVPPTYMYDNQVQFPIDGQLQGNYIFNNTGSTSGTRGTIPTAPEDHLSHNFHYTYELHITFTYKSGQVFTFIGDDDVWVFINKKLVIDLGGVHSSLPGTITLNASAKSTDEVNLNLVDGQEYQFDFFYAERHTTQSHMKITTSIPLNSSTIPN